jgi:hypothetical protein
VIRTALATLTLVVATSGCGDDGARAVKVTVPPVAPSVQRACERLAADLPPTIGNGLFRRTTSPASPLVAAWGEPAVVLRCGAPPDPSFKQGDQLIEVTTGGGKVGWWANRDGKDVTWSTPRATVNVEVRVPGKYQGADVLQPLTAAVSKVSVL